MKELNQSAQAHYVLGAKYLDQAKREPQAAKSPSSYYGKALLEFKRAIDLNPTYHEALNGFAYTYWVFRLRWPQEDINKLGVKNLDTLPPYYADKAFRLAKMQQNDYQEMLYAATKAEVSMANGDFQTARTILLAQKVPDSYILDEIRWDLAQSSLCLMEVGTEEVNKDELEQEAKTNLQEIQAHEGMLETYVLSNTGNEYLTAYRLPCRQFISSQK